MMWYVFGILGIFIVALSIVQVVFFELSRKKMDDRLGISWYGQLEQPFKYNRARRMVLLGVVAYVISGIGESIDAEYFIYMILFVAMAVVADIIVLYLVRLYTRFRCKGDILEYRFLKIQLDKLKDGFKVEKTYDLPLNELSDQEFIRKYIVEDDHVAIMSNDQGEFAKDFESQASILYNVEEFEGMDELSHDTIKFVPYASGNRLPFKDNRINTLINRYVQYNDEEVKRVLRDHGYFIVNQYGDSHLKEILDIYSPIELKVIWNALTCAETLKRQGLNIIEKYDNYGKIKFNSIHSLYTYFLTYGKEFCDIHKYEAVYINALDSLNKTGFYEMTTHDLIVVARK